MLNLNLFLALLSGFIILILVYFFTNKIIHENNNKIKNLVAVAIGIMLTIASIHLLPEAFAKEDEMVPFIFLFSLLSFYIIGWLTHNHDHDHNHDHNSHSHNNLSKKDLLIVPSFIGLSIHTMIDGIIIWTAFSNSLIFGIIISIAIAIHHIPQMSAIALNNKLYISNRNIVIYNLLISMFMIFGIILSYFIMNKIEITSSYLLIISAASFIYIGGHDLTNYLKEYSDNNIKKRILFLILGVLIGLLVEILSH